MTFFPHLNLLPRASHVLLATALFGGALLFSTTASAQNASNKAAAEALFDEGVKLLKAGKVEEACNKLESSQRVDPGIGTLLYLGECYKKAGRTASAWATFREAASKAKAAGEDDRARVGMTRADDLESTLSRVTFEMDEANADIEGIEVRQGKFLVNRALWGSAIPVDPGELVIQVQAPGYEPYETRIEVDKGASSATVNIPALVALPEDEQKKVSGSAPTGAVSATPEDVEPAGSGQRTTGLILGGVGAAGLVAGGIFGVLAISKNNQAKDICSGTTCPADSDGESLTDSAQTFATVSTIGIIAGGALFATGGVLYFTAPSSDASAELRVSPTWGGARFTLGGSF